MTSAACFVLMPFGKRTDPAGVVIDFDAVYRDLIEPGIRAASLEPVRADQEVSGGLIYRSVFERLVLCDYAIADLTLAAPTVFYELGVRHALRKKSTVLLLAEGQRASIDASLFPFLSYSFDSAGKPRDPGFAQRLGERLRAAAQEISDSPVFQMLPNLKQADLEIESQTAFRDLASEVSSIKGKIASARGRGPAALVEIENGLEDIAHADSAVVTDLFLSYRAVGNWNRMIALVDKMSPALRETEMVQQQLALALNRSLLSEQAEAVLLDLLRKRGPSSETYGILGRIFKDQWENAKSTQDFSRAAQYLDKAIDAYVRGFETDWRDAYPGINAVTLMELRDPPDERRKQILPVVQYCVERRLSSGNPDYWDYASRLELAVLANDETLAHRTLDEALSKVREIWEPETTARNLRLIRTARESRGEDSGWLAGIEKQLRGRIESLVA